MSFGEYDFSGEGFSVSMICIAGKNDIACFGLDFILNSFVGWDVVFIPNSTDDGVDGWQPSFKKFALSMGVRQVELEELYGLTDLVFVSLEYSKIIDPRRFKSGRLFNIHFSMLPKYKGMFTSTIPLLFGDRSSGVTLHEIDSGIDTGSIIDQIEFDLSEDDTARDLYFKYMQYGRDLFVRNVQSLLDGDYRALPQAVVGASYFSKTFIDYSNLRIDFKKTAWEVHNQFRAFTFKEYQLPIFKGFEIVKTQILGERSRGVPGCVSEEQNSFFVVSTIDYDLKLFKGRACP